MLYNSKIPKVSLCIMVWNELKGCELDIPRLPRECFYEIFAVDGGSTDGTVEFLKLQGIPVYQQPVKSLNAAYHYAVELCRGEALVVWFPKGTINPQCIKDIARNLDGKTELVIASRNIKGARNEEDDHIFKFRKWGVMLLALFSAIIWRREGAWIRDVLHGVKGFYLAAFKRMAIPETGVTVDLAMTVRSYRLHIPRKEIPVIEHKRSSGETRFRIFPTAKSLGAFLLKELLRPSSSIGIT
jgi:glycosyltransferase involved in cell wall biosynthesis